MTTATITSKVKILKIEIDRVEGPINLCGKRTFVTWKEAEAYLRSVGMEKPRSGTADKTDFRLVYEDGETYAGRYEAGHPEGPSYYGTLGEHVRKHLEFVSGLAKPSWMKQERYDELMAEYRVKYPTMEADSLRFLKGYALIDTVTTTDAPSVNTPATSGKESAMTTAAPSAPTTTDKPDSKAARAENLRIRDEQGLPPVKITGNTFAVRRVLWTLGGAWNGDDQCWLLPAHTAAEGQRITDEVNAKAAARKAEKDAASKPAPTAKPVVQTPKPAPVASKPAPTVTAKPAPVVNRPTNPAAGKLQPRVDALAKGAKCLLDAATAEGDAALIETLVKVLELVQGVKA